MTRRLSVAAVAGLLLATLFVAPPVRADATITRAAGADRIATAIELSRSTFSSASTAVVAASTTFADALAATPLAAAVGGPVLLNPPGGLDDRVARELDRLGIGRVLLMGGTAAQSADVEQQLEAQGHEVERVAGRSRFGTAAAAAARASGGEAPEVLVALGSHPDPTRAWPDALAAGALAGQTSRPILLVTPDEVPAETRQALSDLGVDRAVVVGGTAAIPESTADDLGVPTSRIAGATRYETAVRAAEAATRAGASASLITVATGAGFADALAAGAATVARGGVLLLVPPTDLESAAATTSWLRSHRGDAAVVVAGGPAAVPEPVVGQIRWAVSGFNQPSVRLTTVYRSGTPLGVVPAAGVGPVVFERGGRIATLGGATLTDLGGRTRTDGERGLLGVAFHPDHAANNRVFVHYSHASDGDTIVSEMRRSGGSIPLTSERVLFRLDQPAANHNGGTLTFGPDGMLYLFLGDGGGSNNQFGTAQDRSSKLGAILRFDVSEPGAARPATGNPYIGRDGDDWLWAKGLRNPFRASFDEVTDILYIGDVGQGSWEEVDAEPAGAAGLNYGWDVLEGTHCFQASSCDRSGYTMPVLEYPTHDNGTCGVIGGHVYRGSAGGQASGMLRGHYFYGDLCAGFVRSFRLEGGAAVEQTSWPELSVGSVLSFGTDAAGNVYVSDGSAVHRLDVTG